MPCPAGITHRNAWRCHSGLQGVDEFLLSCSDLFSKITYPEFLDGHAEARKVSGWRSARCLWKAEHRKALVPVLTPLNWPVILETDNLPKEAHWTRACGQKDEGQTPAGSEKTVLNREGSRTKMQLPWHFRRLHVLQEVMICNKELGIYGPSLSSRWIQAITWGWCTTLGTLGILQTKPFLESESSVYYDHQHSLQPVRVECVNSKVKATVNMEEGLWG